MAELVQRVLEQSGYLESLEAERTIEARGRIENLQELVGVAQEYAEQAEEPTLSEFLQQISLFSDQDTIREEQSLVTLMTLHNAKGLEFGAVFMIGMEEGIFPHARSVEEQGIEEERRLAYVGMTRAKEQPHPHPCLQPVALGQPRLQPPFALPRRAAAGRGRARAAAAGLLVELRRAGRVGDPAARRRARALDRRLGAARDARRGRRRRHRAGRSGHGALRGRRGRAQADARIRPTGKDLSL